MAKKSFLLLLAILLLLSFAKSAGQSDNRPVIKVYVESMCKDVFDFLQQTILPALKKNLLSMVRVE